MKRKIIIIAIVILPMLCLICLDFLNITSFLPFTEKYDWLAFFGAYITGLCTLVLGIVTINQNKTLSDLNKKMLNNNMVATRFSQIDLEKENFYDPNILTNYKDSYGIKMIEENKNKKDKLSYIRLILQLKDKYDLPLMYGKIDKLDIFYNYEKPYENEDRKTYLSNGEEVELEVTPHEDKITYYLPICIIDETSELEKINKSKKIRIVAKINIKNSFNVVSTAEYTIHLTRDNQASENWVRYNMNGRKIYFKEVIYNPNEY